MGSKPFYSEHCFNLYSQLEDLASYLSYTRSLNRETMDFLLHCLWDCCNMVNDANIQHKYGKPMMWIGIYIATASLFCSLAMAADLFHGVRNRKLWFPCKYFTLNVASITVITVATKLSLDLNNPMPGRADQEAKLGSMALMCTMVANLIPSMASMGNKELLANVIGLVILIITIVVNVLIQVTTGLLHLPYSALIIMYVGMILSLLVILTSLAVTIPTSKQILEFKYQVAHKTASNNPDAQHTRLSTIDELIRKVRRYWVMAGSCSPQFVTASTPLCSAAGIICATSTALYFLSLVIHIMYHDYDYRSDYRWSVFVILITQSIGVAVGTIAPIFRCFASLSFKLTIKWSRNHMKVFKVEKYWTQKLLEWKQSHIAFLSSDRRSKTFVHSLKNLILCLCIGFQKVVVVSCKMIGLIPIAVVIFFVYCLYCWNSLKAIFFATAIASRQPEMVQELEQNETKEDISNYVLQLEDEIELSNRALKGISNSVNRLIQKAEKQPPNNLLKLLKKSTGFVGVENFDNDQVQPLLSVELLNSWSLPVVTLTCIAIALPSIRKDMVDSLLSSVGEAILYTGLVEEGLNSAGEFVNIRRATMTLWHEVEDNCKWLENTLQIDAYKGKTSTQILEWFACKAEEIVVEINKSAHGELVENPPDKLIVANSMYRITQTIMLNCQSSTEQISEDQLFALLSGMIADIVAACLTNLPRVITMKCHESAIEKREASVGDAAKLLGRTKEVMNKLQVRKLPSLDPDQMAFIDEWRLYLKQSIP